MGSPQKLCLFRIRKFAASVMKNENEVYEDSVDREPRVPTGLCPHFATACQVAFGKLLLFPVAHFTVRDSHFTFTCHKWEVRTAPWLLRSISIFLCLKPCD